MTEKSSNLAGLDIVLGVSGGIAAYKAVDLASKLTQAGAKVHTVMTANACQLVGPKSFEGVTGLQIFTTLWSPSEQYKIEHVHLADEADIVVVAPATANIIAKMANGICDDILSTTLCTCWAKPTLIAPAMNDNMWNNPAVRANVGTLKKRGVETIGPETGRLACGTEAVGRMSEPAQIIEALERIAQKLKSGR
jgi:phosphopantothenoylcysteine synthetase/decarboxylase